MNDMREELLRKAFEKWYNQRFSNRNSELCEHGAEDMLEAYNKGYQEAVDDRSREMADEIFYTNGKPPKKSVHPAIRGA